MVYSTENFYKTFELVRKRIPYKICIKAINPEEILLRSDIKDLNGTSAFIEAYEAVTHSCFKVLSNKNVQNRLSRRRWICNHTVVSGMHEKCPASISILIKKINKQNVLKDAFLRRNPPHRAVIKINPNHNHFLMIPVAPHKLLKINKDVKDCFYEYFKRGYCGARAKWLHEQYLRKTNFHAFGDESMNPLLPAIFALHKSWLEMTGSMQINAVSNYGSVGSVQALSIQKNGNNIVPQSSSQNFEEFINMEDIRSKLKKEPDDEYIANEVFEDIKPVLNIKQEIIDEDEDCGLPVISSYGSLATVKSPTSPPQPVAATKAKQGPTKKTMQNVAAVVKTLQPSSSQFVVYDQSSNTVKVVKCLAVGAGTYSANQYQSHLPCTLLPSRISL